MVTDKGVRERASVQSGDEPRIQLRAGVSVPSADA